MPRRLTIVVSGWPRFQPTRVSARFRYGATPVALRRPAVLHAPDALPEAPLDAHQVDFYLRRRPPRWRRGRRSPGRRAGRCWRARLAFGDVALGRLRDRSRGGYGGAAAGFAAFAAARCRLGATTGFLAGHSNTAPRAPGRFVGVVDDLRRRVDALDRGPAARGGFAQHEGRVYSSAVGRAVERGGRPRRRLIRRPEGVGAPVRRHDGDARLAHRGRSRRCRRRAGTSRLFGPQT